ncbi:MAG: hypothetical protein JWM58_2325 [Rhizobium sp.]|nr:hypothetical protein [Rhizobium sp.]
MPCPSWRPGLALIIIMHEHATMPRRRWHGRVRVALARALHRIGDVTFWPSTTRDSTRSRTSCGVFLREISRAMLLVKPAANESWDIPTFGDQYSWMPINSEIVSLSQPNSFFTQPK